jgi:hypothetical protein
MKISIFLSFFIILALSASQALAMGTAPPVKDLGERISLELHRLDDDLEEAAGQLSTTGLRGEKASNILLNLYKEHYSIIDIATIDLDGNLVLIEPAKYKGAEGKNITDQSHFAQIKTTNKPVLSEMFKTVEGFYAVSLAYPIISEEKNLIGFVSAVLQPNALARKVIESSLSDFPEIEAMIIQKDGRIIYDRDILQVGKMTFSDPLYQSSPSLLALAASVTKEAEGTGSYIFQAGWGKEPVKKDAEWTTISLHGIEWRLLLSKTAD